MPFAGREEARAPRRRRKLGAFYLVRGFLETRAAADGFDRDGFEDQRFLAINEAEARFVRALKGGFYFR